MGCFATGVTVVTAVGKDGDFVGVTVNSFNSLSLDPPLVLWSLAVGSPLMQAFEHASHFAVNVLAEDQIEISQRFALRAVDKFADLNLLKGAGGSPLIADCMAWIECRNRSHDRHGDHVLFIGEVERMAESAKKPLLFLRGHYGGAGERVV
jgi:flavin reductase (DIM6/NTAB) family NADH-FMN oxidoreductase RutF